MRTVKSLNRQVPTPSEMGWKLLAALGFAQICSWGTLYYSFPQIAVAMSGEFGWDKSEVYGALTLGLLLSGAAAIPVGIAIDRGHGRAIMVGGSILAGILFFLWAQTQSLLWFYVVFSGIGALQAMVLYGAAFAVVARHYDSTKTRTYITTLTLWGGFASTLFIPLIELLMGHLGWRQVLVVLGVVNILVCSGIYACLPSKHAITKDNDGANPAHLMPTETAKSNADQSITWVLKQSIFWLLLISFALYAGIGSAYRFHLYPMLIEMGLTGENAVYILALLGPAQVAGRVLILAFKTKSTAQLSVFVASLFPLSFIAMTFFPGSFPIMIIAALIYGFAAGTMTILKGVAVPELLTKKSYGLINGIMEIPITALKAFAPAIAAISWSVTGGYVALMYGLVAMSLIMLVLFIAMAFYPRTTD